MGRHGANKLEGSYVHQVPVFLVAGFLNKGHLLVCLGMGKEYSQPIYLITQTANLCFQYPPVH